MTKQNKQIPRKLWLMAFKRWYKRSKQALTEGRYKGWLIRDADCGYCTYHSNRARVLCEECALNNKYKVCRSMRALGGNTAYWKWYSISKTDMHEEKATHALTIFRAIVDHGKTLKTASGKSYVTATQEKQITELDELEKKMFGEGI
jgi:hypothetical protein